MTPHVPRESAESCDASRMCTGDEGLLAAQQDAGERSDAGQAGHEHLLPRERQEAAAEGPHARPLHAQPRGPARLRARPPSAATRSATPTGWSCCGPQVEGVPSWHMPCYNQAGWLGLTLPSKSLEVRPLETSRRQMTKACFRCRECLNWQHWMEDRHVVDAGAPCAQVM